MKFEAIGTGKSVDEAIEAACSEMGVPRENVDIDILELPKKKLFGLMSVPAKVKVTLQEEYAKKYAPKEKPKAEPKPVPQQKKQEQKPAPQQKKQEPKPAQEKPVAPKPVQEKPVAPKAAQEKPVASKAAQEKPVAPKPAQEKPVAPKPAQEKPVAPKAEKPAEEVKPLEPEVVEMKGSAAATYIGEILVALGHSDAKVDYFQKDGMIVLQLSGEDMGAVVGRRGDNLDALQYLASLVANRSEGNYVRVVLDIDDYRSKREASLQAYARKTAIQAVRSGRSITLESMNPYERRIVHSTVQTVNGATSRSVGTEPNRRVVIAPVDGAKPRGDRRPPRSGNNGDRPQKPPYRQNRDRGDRPERPESKKVFVEPNGEPPKNDTSAISLYGKINLD